MRYLNSFFLVASLVTGLTSLELMASDRLEVDLKNAARDPLIDFTSPIAGSPDRVEVTRDGLLIRQGRDKPGVAKRDTGFKFLLSASGDFKASLDLKKVRLDEPTSGWGQGLIFSVWLDDPEQSVLQICLLALPGSGLTIRAERIGRKVTPPVRKVANVDFDNGTFVIGRVGKKASFALINGTTKTPIFEIDCGTGDVQSLSVWCTRQDKGNAPAEYLLRSLTVEANGFYSYKKSSDWFTWWHGMGLTSLAALAIGIFLKVRGSMKRNS